MNSSGLIFLPKNIPLDRYTTRFLYLLINCWTFGMSHSLAINNAAVSFVCMFSFLLDRYLGEKLNTLF